MASTNEEIPPPTKPRISPLEYRNTDLVSRLLAATPPYLYNMSMVPNTYFFSEMLRSFVQAKADRSSVPLARRSRKRSWTQTKTSDSPTLSHPKLQKLPIEDTWKPNADTNLNYYDEQHKLALSTDNKEKLYAGMFQPSGGQMLPPTSTTHTNSTHATQPQSNTETSSSLILPPPPPIWYPPLYNTPPYGIDPLHFFIDLRVSGHIYDRKKSLEKAQEDSDVLNSNSSVKDGFLTNGKPNVFKSSKHASAFSVPIKNHAHPINLSKAEDVEHKPMKFDVKSLGLESTHNKTGINYVMNNIERVYKDLYDSGTMERGGMGDEEERKKRELKELIGLELAVDYMSQNNKNGIKSCAEGAGGGLSENEGDGGGVEVIDVQNDNSNS